MEKATVVTALAALAQESRLDICQVLVRAGPNGLPAGHIGEQLGLPSATLAFHLKQLKYAGLVNFTRVGRSLIYSTVDSAMSELLAYLTENCGERGEATGLAEVQAPPGIKTRMITT